LVDRELMIGYQLFNIVHLIIVLRLEGISSAHHSVLMKLIDIGDLELAVVYAF
jgi:hypothetical protein